MKRWLVPLALSLVLLAAGCGEERRQAPPRPTPTPTVAATVTEGTRTVTDMVGRRIRVPEKVERVVVLSPSARDFAAALGLDVVGQPTDVAGGNASPVGTTLNPDFPAIAALDPDLVIADGAFHGSRTRDFDGFPYPVFILAAGNYLGILIGIEALGEAVDLGAEARTAIDALQAEVDEITAEAESASAGKTPPRVLIFSGAGRDVFGGGTTTYVGGLVQMLGGENVLGEIPEGGPLPGYGVIGVSEAAIHMPDIVLILSAGEGGLADDIRSDPAWAAVPAVNNNRLHELDRELFLRAPGPRVVEALETLLPLLWP